MKSGEWGMGNGDSGICIFPNSHSPLHTPSFLLTHEQLLRVPERVGDGGARAVIAYALIGCHRYMARDDGDDR
jgi:hypothetical protein